MGLSTPSAGEIGALYPFCRHPSSCKFTSLPFCSLFEIRSLSRYGGEQGGDRSLARLIYKANAVSPAVGRQDRAAAGAPRGWGLGSCLAPWSTGQGAHVVGEFPGAAANPVPAGREGLSPGTSEGSVRVCGRGLPEASRGPKAAAVSRVVPPDSVCSPHGCAGSAGIAAVRARGDLGGRQPAPRGCDWKHWSLPGSSVALSQQPAPAAKGIYSNYTAHPVISHDREENLFDDEEPLQITDFVSLGRTKPLNAAWLNALSVLCVINNS